jgi:hypothetical protein
MSQGGESRVSGFAFRAWGHVAFWLRQGQERAGAGLGAWALGAAATALRVWPSNGGAQGPGRR